MPSKVHPELPNLARFAQTEVVEHGVDVVRKSKKVSKRQRSLDRNHWQSKLLLDRYTPVTNLAKNRILQIAAGSYHSLLVDDCGRVWAFGEGSHGQLGLGNTETQLEPKGIGFFDNKNVKQVSAGQTFSLCLTYQGDVYSWGKGSFGELGQGEYIRKCLQPQRISFEGNAQIRGLACGGCHVIAISRTQDSSLFVWGRNENGQLGLGTRQNSSTPKILQRPWHAPIRNIFAGERHSVILTEPGDVWVWGRGRHGQLMSCTAVEDCLEPKLVEVLQDVTIESISCGRRHTAILTDEGRVFLFGGSSHAQHGNLSFEIKGNIQGNRIVHISSGGNMLYVVDDVGKAHEVSCSDETGEAWELGVQFARFAHVSKLIWPQERPRPLVAVPIDDLAEEVRNIDALVDDMLIEMDGDGADVAKAISKTWDARSIFSTDVIERWKDGRSNEIDTKLFAGKRPFFGDELVERSHSPREVAQRTRDQCEKFQSQLRNRRAPQALVRQPTLYKQKLGEQVAEKQTKSEEEYFQIKKEAARWENLLIEQGWNHEVQNGNYIPYQILYDIQTYGRRLEDDNLILEMRRYFYFYDRDGSGEIDACEFCIALRQLGYFISLRGTRKIIKKFDRDGNGTIGLDEFLDFCYTELVKASRDGGFMKKFFRRNVVGKTEPPPPIPPKLPPARLRREERERTLYYKFGKKIRKPGRIFPDTYMRFVKIFMNECMQLEIWNSMPQRLHHQFCVPSAQPLFHHGEIDLSDCEITDKYVQALCNTVKCAPMIRRLDLRRNKITKFGARMIADVLLCHDELADYVDCAKCLECGSFNPFADPSNPRTPSISCGCSPFSRGGREYLLPVYWLEHVVIEDPMTKEQRLASRKLALALELDDFTSKAFGDQKGMRHFLKVDLPPFRKHSTAASQFDCGIKKEAFAKELEKVIENSQSDLKEVLTKSVSDNVKIREIQRVFLEADGDNSGFLDMKELKICLRKLGIDKKHAKMIFKELDEDGNGLVTLQELEQIADKLASFADLRMLGRRRRAASHEHEDQEIAFLMEELKQFGSKLVQDFHMLHYAKNARRNMEIALMKMKREAFERFRKKYHSSTRRPPHGDATVQELSKNLASSIWEKMRQTFLWSVDDELWAQSRETFDRYMKELEEHYLTFERQIRVVSISAGPLHSFCLTERKLPWLKGFHDNGKRDSNYQFNQRLVKGIESLEKVTIK